MSIFHRAFFYVAEACFIWVLSAQATEIFFCTTLEIIVQRIQVNSRHEYSAAWVRSDGGDYASLNA